MEKTLKSFYFMLALALVTSLVTVVTKDKFASLRSEQQSVANDSPEAVQKNLDCLAMNIYREAGYEPFEGKVAVAQVTINRAKDDTGRFPNKICEVVHQKNMFYEKVVCQFSWYCDRESLTPVNKQKYQESYAVAKKVYLEGFRLDGLDEALYYHADYMNPNWNLQKVLHIGQHIFYKDRDNDRLNHKS